MADHERERRRVERKVFQFVRDERLFRDGERVLLAVSGGPDSTALLLVLSALQERLGIELAGVGYFDHGLRPDTALDIRFVRELSERCRLPFLLGQGQAAVHARASGQSLEAAARELRYRFLAQAAGEVAATVVATGHTADDQAETVLLHLIRGTGLRGLAGMRPRSAWPVPEGEDQPVLVRPLLGLRKTETEAYCRALEIAPRQDVTNQSPVFLRNRVRWELLPLLRGYNPRIDQALWELARSLAADLAVLEPLAKEALAATATLEADRVRLARARLLAAPEGLQRHVLQLAVRHLLGQGAALPAYHGEAILKLARGPAGRRLSLAQGLIAEAGYEDLILQLGPGPETPPIVETALTVPGVTDIGPWRVTVEEVEVWQWTGDLWTAYLALSAVDRALSLRTRRPGDRFQPWGMSHEKKLQDFFVDEKVPRAERDAVPLICTPDGRIAWVVGYRVAQWAGAQKGSPALRVQVERAGV